MKIKFPPGLAALAVAAVIYGGDKPDPPPKPRTELVIIVEPIADGMYSTRTLHIEKEELENAKAKIGL